MICKLVGRRLILACEIAFTLAALGQQTAQCEQWTQFRGPNATGHSVGVFRFPVEIGPNSAVIWKVPLPPGHSSPVVTEKRIFVTAVENDKLWTIALDRATGRTLWKKESFHSKLEEIHSIGSYAQATPTTDGNIVVSLFGSSGLTAYDQVGNQLWMIPMGPFNNDFGAASSPILVDDFVILCQDHDTDSFLMAVEKRTGKIVWKTDRSEFPRNFGTAVIWNNAGRPQVVVAGTLRVVGYDLHTGVEAWTVRGISRTVCATPVVGGDGNLYVAGWSAGGDPGERINVEPFDKIVGAADANNDGLLSSDELPTGDIKQRFTQVDRDNDGQLSRDEYDYFRGLFEKSKNVVLAIRPGAAGDSSETHVLWSQEKHVPFCASPIWVNDHIFTIRDGGIFASIDAKTGKLVKQHRLPATNDYYSSPVVANDHIYLINQEGKLTVVSAQGTWRVAHSADFHEEVYATPALVDGRIYLRTAAALYCFGR